MSALDIILLPFVFIYRGFITVLLLPYYFVIGIGKVFGIGKNKKEEKAHVMPEVKPGETVKVVKEKRSAYETPKAPVKETDPVKISKEKEKGGWIRVEEGVRGIGRKVLVSLG